MPVFKSNLPLVFISGPYIHASTIEWNPFQTFRSSIGLARYYAFFRERLNAFNNSYLKGYFVNIFFDFQTT